LRFAKYLGKRLISSLITLAGVVLVLVLLTKFIPGDPARVIAGLNASTDEVARIRQSMGLDQPVPVQFWRFIVNLLHGNLGTSARTGNSVVSEIATRIPYTVELALLGTLIGAVFGILLGVIAATRKGTWVEGVVSTLGVLGISMPVYWLGILLIMLFAVQLKWLPVAGADSPSSVVLPSIAIGVALVAVISRVTNSSMIEVLGQDYIRSIRAKGSPERVAVFRHALRNALIPVITVIGLEFGTLLGGAVLTETVFGWPGIGQLAVTSIQARDYPMVQGIVFVFSVLFILVNIITDVLYTVVDPRVKLYG
jgi:ABC-type dipeptide/oligopeptide/nickel transport system permease component